ncbi:unnamed protein product [Dovyalis caffra]|uniref:TF-B3 domain-containing protein n=1 Tax=Dovyalis caffra TaxID=77055 RepID=A0AAV1SMW9_9ROSI|nr:unnamed protein product [Dovyalis caffra]
MDPICLATALKLRKAFSKSLAKPLRMIRKKKSRTHSTERAMPRRRNQDDHFIATKVADRTEVRGPGQPSKEKISEEISQSRRMLEKHKYWVKFDPTRHQFFKVMVCEFRNQLVIPKQFANRFQEKLSDTIRLRGPSGHIWAVKLTKTTNDWLFQNGWVNFVQDHGLEEADFLVFQYEGNSSFKVTIFTKTGCEREGSYFIKEHTSSCSRFCSAKPNVDSDYDPMENVITLNESNNKNKQKGKTKKERENQRDESMMVHYLFVYTKSYGKQGWEKSYSYYLLSNRRQVTAEEKKRARLLAAKHSSTQPSFKRVMKPTNVYHYFFLCIPKEWRKKHIPATNGMEIELRVPASKKTWSVRLKNNKYKFGIGKGWCKFVLDNNLEESDICIFELKQGAKANKETVIFNVIIFRVVAEVVPLRPSTKVAA